MVVSRYRLPENEQLLKPFTTPSPEGAEPDRRKPVSGPETTRFGGEREVEHYMDMHVVFHHGSSRFLR